jgi:hypothetical protein
MPDGRGCSWRGRNVRASLRLIRSRQSSRKTAMRRMNYRDARPGRWVLLGVAAVLVIAMLGFYITGPVNKVAVMANAPAYSQLDPPPHH